MRGECASVKLWDLWIRSYCSKIKKVESQGKKCNTRTMMHNETCEAYKMSTHHLPLEECSGNKTREDVRRGGSRRE